MMATDLIVKDVVVKSNSGVDVIFGNFVGIFGIYFITYIGIALGILFKKFLHTRGLEKLQIKYLALGLALTIFFATATNFLIPLFFRTFGPSQFGPYFTIFFVGLTTYAIISKKLFKIRIVLTAIFIGLIGLILLVQAIVAPSIPLKIINGTILVFFILFGYLLLRSVMREIKLKEQLEVANRELERIDEAKTEFLSIASHQLRTPLTAIKGYLAMVQEGIYGQVSDSVNKVIDKVYDSNERLVRLVNSLLDISRLEMGRMQFQFEKADLDAMIESIVDELHIAAKKKGLNLVYQHTKEPLPEVTIDAEKIRQVMLNLIDNAIKYTYKGEVIIKVKRIGNKLQILVSDTGMGIARKEVNEIFKIYKRGTGVRLFPEGSGVGLYVARKMINAHKGKIWAQSKGKGKGSNFYVELPINGRAPKVAQ
jgi:signal transduction histidine kinase